MSSLRDMQMYLDYLGARAEDTRMRLKHQMPQSETRILTLTEWIKQTKGTL